MLRNALFFIGTFILLINSSPVSAEIIETNEILTIQQYVTKDSLVLFNVSDTLYVPATMLGDHQWRVYFADRVNKVWEGEYFKEHANRLINNIKNQIVNYVPKKAVEEITPQLIADLQNQHIPVVGITQKQMATAYADNFGLITSNHLLKIGIDLGKTLNYLNVKDVDQDNDYSFAFGIIFTNKGPVGPSMLSFLNRLNHMPEKIILIDNSLENLENAETSLISTGIIFEGFRYGRADELKKSFDPIIGTIQFIEFWEDGRIVSNEEARQIRQSNPDFDYVEYLDMLIFHCM